jgi:hypothetical protein
LFLKIKEKGMKEYLAPGACIALFFIAFMAHSFWPFLIGVPLLVLFWSQKKESEQPEHPYYVPSSQNQTSAAHIPYQDTAPAAPKESPRWEQEQPMAQYPEQLPPMA